LDSVYIDVSDEGSKTLNVFTSKSAMPPQQYTSLSSMLGALGSLPAFVLLPEQELSAVISGLTTPFQAALLSYVTNGGTLVYASMGDSNSLSMQNQLFGWSISSADCSSISTSLDPGQASNTSFSGGPATLPPLNAVRCISRASLPAGSLPVYYSGSAVSVFRATVGVGHVIGLAPDWYSTSTEWNTVLMMAIQTATDCKGQCQAGTFWNTSVCSACPAGSFSNATGTFMYSTHENLPIQPEPNL
jgi:hypothetical protein